jgi:tripeptidyl-peptidase I
MTLYQTFITDFQPLESAATTFTVTTLDNGRNTQSAAQAGTEANLDIEYTVGLALGVPVTFLTVGGNDFTQALLDTTQFLDGVASPPTVMTTSYGTNENTISKSLAT